MSSRYSGYAYGYPGGQYADNAADTRAPLHPASSAWTGTSSPYASGYNDARSPYFQGSPSADPANTRNNAYRRPTVNVPVYGTSGMYAEGTESDPLHHLPRYDAPRTQSKGKKSSTTKTRKKNEPMSDEERKHAFSRPLRR